MPHDEKDNRLPKHAKTYFGSSWDLFDFLTVSIIFVLAVIVIVLATT